MNTSTTFEALPLAAFLQSTLRELNYATPSLIQAQAIPPLLEGRDLLGAAQTGTGKTAAFALPILHKLAETPKRMGRNKVRTLVLTPTRELAVQVASSFNTYGKGMTMRCMTVYGGVGAHPQIRGLSKGVDVLVATPGRLLDLYGQGHVDFSEVEFFVLDEADRMLDMGFLPDIRKVVAQLPSRRQSLFFSATMSPEITRFAGTILNNPAEIRIQPEVSTAERVDHRMCFVAQEDRNKLLQKMVMMQQEREGRHLTLVFSRTKHGADRLVKTLGKEGIQTAAIHGNKSQAARQKALDRFRSGRVDVLIATDVAARGIDVKDITMVINYDLPDEAEAYVHRIGRTARGGAAGHAYSYCTEGTLSELRTIERLIGEEIPVFVEHPYHNQGLMAKRSAGGGRGRPSNKRSGGGPRRPGQGRRRFDGGKRKRARVA